ncbi:MAG: protein-glutamate O-methyltransferase CheR [Myxococcales bacterium]
MIPITREELGVWSKLVWELCGIVLDDSKGSLLETRLAALMSEQKAVSYSELHRKVRDDPGPKLRQQVVDAIATNETSFFRDTSPFELLRHKLVPELVDRRRRLGLRPVPLRIWSAACSTGQEVYSTGIVLKELLGDLTGYDIRILGTDISNRAMAAASYAYYSRAELERGMPAGHVARYFVPVGDQWKVRDEIRAMATFRTLNLLQPFSFPAPFDLIFCRNVALYFSEADRSRLYRRLAEVLAPDGYLLIGATESIGALCPEARAPAPPALGLLPAQEPALGNASRRRRLRRAGRPSARFGALTARTPPSPRAHALAARFAQPRNRSPVNSVCLGGPLAINNESDRRNDGALRLQRVR